MKPDQHYQAWSSLLRTSQEMMWSSTQIPVERAINERAGTASGQELLGSLTLDPALKIPSYHTAVDIHCQPGGYHTEYVENDLAQGAIYDRAVYIYAMGQMGLCNADMGDNTVAWLKQSHPDFNPSRILDMGCSVGHSTAYSNAYPEAEMHAIDVAAPMLRYAHARASSMGSAVHFSQQNAECTNLKQNLLTWWSLIFCYMRRLQPLSRTSSQSATACSSRAVGCFMWRRHHMRVWSHSTPLFLIGTAKTITSLSGERVTN